MSLHEIALGIKKGRENYCNSENFVVENKFGSPRTPCAILVDGNGKVMAIRHCIAKGDNSFFRK